ncbi:putative copper amine oxidase [Neofusicoccum parvum]|uniref:Copper amine oxidase n=1 Tax=Neofusicoccum parvum TaxID=310453 RepID=A0ACB5RWA4_9PEZI|nr:putative copper amine oxidase [Neofusicoccum parvum]
MSLQIPPSSFDRPTTTQPPAHPLDPLTAQEIQKAAALFKESNPGKSLHFKRIALIEPPKAQLRPYLQAELRGQKPAPLPRRVTALYRFRGEPDLFVAEASLSDGAVERVTQLDSRIHGQADIDEVIGMRDLCMEHPAVKKELERLKLPEGVRVQCDTWPYGRDNRDEKRRLIQCFMYACDLEKQHAGSNAYDFPLDFSPVFDIATKELVTMCYLPLGAEVERQTPPQEGHVPHKPREFHPELLDTPLRSDLKPLHVSQPQGASFTVDGHLVTWQKWRFRLGFNWREGMVLHNVTYDGRELFHRLSLAEMFVPYGSPQSPYHRKSVFDVGDIGAGVCANDLRLGCDCLGLIKYFSFVICNSNGDPVEKPNAVCMHEQDNGIGWKHTNSRTGEVSITRSRILVLQTIITVGNYDYIFAWHLDQAAGLHYNIQATGILSTAPIAPNTQVPWGTNVNEGVVAHFHQHIFCLRIDPSLDGPRNSFIEEDSIPLPLDANNPFGVGYITQKRTLTTSTHSTAAPNRVHKITNPNILNRTSGHPVAYAIHSPVKQMLLAHPESWHARRAAYAQHPFWVTRYRDAELYPAGDYTYQSLPAGDLPANDGVAAWAARRDPTENEDIVVWHSISLTHNPRTEDYPVMPCDTMTVSLKPSGFFDANPALDVPQSTQEGNRSVEVGDGAACQAGCAAVEKPKL